MEQRQTQSDTKLISHNGSAVLYVRHIPRERGVSGMILLRAEIHASDGTLVSAEGWYVIFTGQNTAGVVTGALIPTQAIPGSESDSGLFFTVTAAGQTMRIEATAGAVSGERVLLVWSIWEV